MTWALCEQAARGTSASTPAAKARSELQLQEESACKCGAGGSGLVMPGQLEDWKHTHLQDVCRVSLGPSQLQIFCFAGVGHAFLLSDRLIVQQRYWRFAY